MRVVEIASRENGIVDRCSLLQEQRGEAGALDLANCALGQPSGPAEQTLSGSWGDVGAVTL
jgi:hypothetical protein